MKVRAMVRPSIRNTFTKINANSRISSFQPFSSCVDSSANAAETKVVAGDHINTFKVFEMIEKNRRELAFYQNKEYQSLREELNQLQKKINKVENLEYKHDDLVKKIDRMKENQNRLDDALIEHEAKEESFESSIEVYKNVNNKLLVLFSGALISIIGYVIHDILEDKKREKADREMYIKLFQSQKESTPSLKASTDEPDVEESNIHINANKKSL